MQESVIHEQEYTSRFDLDLWRKILAYLRPHRMRLVPFFALASTIALAEASFHLITRQVIDTSVRDGVSARLWPFAVLYLGLMVLIGFSLWGFIWLGGRISSSIVHEVRRRGFERLQELEFAYYDKRPVGWLMARLTSDCERLGNIITWGCLDLVWGMSMMGGIAAIMLWLDWRLALLVLAVVPVMAVVALYFQRVILASSRTVRKHNSRITAAYNEAIMGVETTKTLVREQANLAEFSVVAGEMRSAALRNAIQSALLFPAVITLGACGSALALWFGGEAVLAGGISLGTLVAFVAYSREFFVPISEMSRIFTELQIAQAAAERILGLIDTVPAIRDNAEVRGMLAAELSTDQRHIARDGGAARIGTIELRDVDFAYVPGQPVLKHINLHVRAGERIALVGPTGGGKSTLVALLCRFYEPTSGQVLLDGVDYRQRSLAWLQAQLGIVLQVPHLFSGSVRENIRYGRLDATNEEIDQAARLVGAHDFIMEAEGGYDARIGQGGVNLSTGQKQLISFARAVLADPAIFVMDEATSSVDTPTEQLIQQGLQVVLHGRTSFIIAHRLSTIRSADRILVIRGGEITEAGTHHELLRLRGHYYRLYTEQFTEESEQRLLHADDPAWATD